MKNYTLASRAQTTRTYYLARKLQEICLLERNGLPVTNLGIGNPDLPPPPVFRSTLGTVAAGDGNHGYQPYWGVPELLENYEKWFLRLFSPSPTPPTGHLPLSGSKEGIFLLSQAFLDPGDEVLVPDPGYSFYQSAATITGARVKTYSLHPENHWMPDPQEIGRLIGRNTRILWLNFPHMPTGVRPNNNLLQEILATALRNGVLPVNDNPYALLCTGKPFSIFQLEEHRGMAVELHSLSKAYNIAGWRMGFLSGPENLIKDLGSIKMQWSTGMPLPVQKAVSKMLSSSDSWLQEQKKEYKTRRQLVWEMCRMLGCTPCKSPGGMFVWSKIPGGYASSYDFTDHLLQFGRIFMAPGSIFGERGEGYVRTSLCAPVPVLKQCIQTLKSHTDEEA